MSTMTLSVSPSAGCFEADPTPGIDDPCLRQLADRFDGTPLRVVEPVGDEGLDRLCSVLAAQLLEPALGNARRAERGEGVAVPLFGDADARPAHTDDVGLIAAVALDAHAREHQRPFLVDVERLGEVARRNAVADVRHVTLGNGGEQVLAADEHRHQEGMVGRVGVAAVRVVVEIRVALADVARVIAAHVLALQVGAEDVHRQAFGRCEQMIVAGESAAGEIAGAGNDCGARRAQQRIGHLAYDAVEPIGDHGHDHGVERVGVRLASGLGHRAPRYDLKM
jgi:hypothetical protein